jgi:hypothetical protein
MARLAVAHHGKKPSEAASKPEEPAADEQIAEAAKRPTRSWPGWALGATAAAAVAATVILALVLPNRLAQDLDGQAVVDGAREFFLDEGRVQSQRVSEVEPPDAYPTDPDFDVRHFPTIRWRSIRSFLGRRGVAYDIGGPGTPRASLYVVQCAVSGLPSAVPPQPASTTRGLAIGAWQRDGLLYVLVVEGGPGIYRQLLPTTTWT